MVENFSENPSDLLQIQEQLGTDIAMVLDECPPFPCEKTACAKAVERSIRWANEFLHFASEGDSCQKGIRFFQLFRVQTLKIRVHCSQALADMPFSGFAVGGVSVGEPEEERNRLLLYASCLRRSHGM